MGRTGQSDAVILRICCKSFFLEVSFLLVHLHILAPGLLTNFIYIISIYTKAILNCCLFGTCHFFLLEIHLPLPFLLLLNVSGASYFLAQTYKRAPKLYLGFWHDPTLTVTRYFQACRNNQNVLLLKVPCSFSCLWVWSLTVTRLFMVWLLPSFLVSSPLSLDTPLPVFTP